LSRPWFAQKQYGVGLSPASPAGWISLGVFVVAMAATGLIVDALHWPVWFIWIGFAVEIAIMLGLIFAKSDGKPWRWRWGDRT
jgi:hypothetical protein